jgi:hypothetical protein
MKQPITPFIIILAMLFSATSYAGNTNTYKWVDEQGNVHYSSRPPAGSNYEKLKVKTPPASSSAQQPATDGATSGTTGSSQPSDGDVVADELAKNQQIRAQNCEAAKKNLQAYTVFKRIKKPDGTVVRLDDKERAQLIEESKANIKEFCD